MDKFNQLVNEITSNSNTHKESTQEAIREICKEYSIGLGYTELEILTAMEKKRTYCATNYYQRSNFPELKDVTIYETKEDLLKYIDLDKGFICPYCGKISKDAYDCNSGEIVEYINGGSGPCNWKSYGLFRLDGFYCMVKENWLESGMISYSFMPVSIKEKQDG